MGEEYAHGVLPMFAADSSGMKIVHPQISTQFAQTNIACRLLPPPTAVKSDDKGLSSLGYNAIRAEDSGESPTNILHGDTNTAQQTTLTSHIHLAYYTSAGAPRFPSHPFPRQQPPPPWFLRPASFAPCRPPSLPASPISPPPDLPRPCA